MFGTTPSINDRIPVVVYDCTYSKVIKKWVACIRGSNVVAFRHLSRTLVQNFCDENSIN
jgi:hypothetical protein